MRSNLNQIARQMATRVFKHVASALLSLFFGASCAIVLDEWSRPACIIDGDTITGNDVRRYANWIHGFDEEPFVSEASINQWFAGERVVELPSELDLLNGMIQDQAVDLDAWKRPLRCIRNRSLANGQVVNVGVYSLGEDGLSNTDGNDPDDINSWNPNTGDFYRSRRNWQRLCQYALFACLFALPVYLIVLFRERRIARDSAGRVFTAG
jgi:hypothetical protein